MNRFSNKRVVVMGLGRFGGGVGVSRFLAGRGASVLVTDLLPAEQLKPSLDKLADLAIDYRLGEHRESDFAAADIVVVSPAVKPAANAYLAAAAAAGATITSEIRLLIGEACTGARRLRTLGVTGSAGKSTTSAMIAHALAAQLGPDRVHLGGNLGGSLLGKLQQIRDGDLIVLELSSFMLDALRHDRWSPHVAVLTNLSPNHLDWHGSADHYQAAKQVIFDYQREADGDAAIVGPGVADLFSISVSRRRSIDAAAPPVPLLLPGKHNQQNAHLAAAAVEAVTGAPSERTFEALADFPGLPHRLQPVAERAGVRYFNDSKSTTPEAAILAIESFPAGTVHAILGGYDKGSDLSRLAQVAGERCRAIYCLGATGRRIADAAERAADLPDWSSVHGATGPSTCGGVDWGATEAAAVVRCQSLDQAVAETARRVREGDAVLLSPGCASWDQFDNYEQRGRRFVEAVLNYTGEGAPPPKV